MAGLPSIVIDQQFGSLGIEVTPAKMKISTPRPEMTITREDPEFSLEHSFPEFELNWKKVRSESGLKLPDDLSKEMSGKSMQKFSKGVSQAVSDGNYLSMVQNPGNRVAQLSRQHTLQDANLEFNIGNMPKSSPEVQWTKGAVNINWTKGNLSIDWTSDYMPEIVLDPPFSVEIYLREKPYIKIMVEDGSIPDMTGTLVDKKL